MSDWKPRTVIVASLLGGLVCASGAWVVGCSGGSSNTFGNQPPPGPALSGVVLDYTEERTRDVPVEVRGGVTGKTRVDGVFQLGPVTTGGILEVGDSITTPTILVPFSAGGVDGTFLDRPVYLPSLESGFGANVPSSTAAVTTISGDALPGVSLRLDPPTVVGNFVGEVRVLGISPSRIPVAVQGGGGQSEPKVAYLVEPHGVTFSPAATLRVPNLERGAGPFDAYRVDISTGRWVQVATNIAPVGSGGVAFDIPVTQGTMYAVAARTAPATVTLTGRIVAGSQPVEGYRASCWGRVSNVTGADGTFTITQVPDNYSVFLVRAYPDQPGVQFQPEVVSTTTTITGLGDLQVKALLPDTIRPTVRATSPRDGQVNVSRSTQVVVTFSEAIDPVFTKPFKLVGVNGTVAGTYRFDNVFTVRFRPTENLKPFDDYSIVLEQVVTDLSGNAIDDSNLTFRFTTAPGAPDPPPTDTLAFGLEPLSAKRGDVIAIPGRNYTGGSVVSFGGTAGLVRLETTDRIEVAVPDFQPAGDVTVSVSTGGVAVGSLFPLVLDLRAGVATIFSGATATPLVLVDRQAPPPTIVVDGSNIGGTIVTVDGVSIAAVDSTTTSGSGTVVTGRTITLTTPASPTLLTGPVVVRGANGKPGKAYRFLQVRD